MLHGSLKDYVLTIVLERPEQKNALNLHMVKTMRGLLRDHGPVAHAVVLKSAVKGYFSIGMDLAELNSRTAEGATSPEVHAAACEYAELLKDMMKLPCPMIAAVDGMAVGGGVDLLGASDVVIASSTSVFSVAQLRKGVFPLTTSGVLIPKIGETEFMFWMLSGQNYSAPKVLKLGLISQIVRPDEIGTRVDQFVQRTLSYNQDALRIGMQAIRSGRSADTVRKLDHLSALLALNCQLDRKTHE